MDLEKIEIGSVIFSKKHNCKVTTVALATDNKIECVWHNENDEHCGELLKSEELELHNELVGE